MRILQLAAYAEVGGVETYTPDLFSELERRGHASAVLAAGTVPDTVLRPGRLVRHWPAFSDLFDTPAARVQEATRFIDEFHPDVTFIHASIDSRLAGLLLERGPCVYFAHTYDAFCASGARFFEWGNRSCQLRGVPDGRCLINAYLRKCNTRRPAKLFASLRRTMRTRSWLTSVDAVVCDSAYVADWHVRNGFDAERVHVLPSPVAIPTKPVGEPRGREDVILYAGRLSRHKGLDHLIRALAQVTAPSRLVVAGSGEEQARLEALASQEGVRERVRFIGRVDRVTLANLYSLAAVVVVPSIWPEPLGMVGPEAMAHGAPVVAFRVGGIPEWLLDGQTGLLVEPGDVKGLARRIDDVLTDREGALRLGAVGRAFVEERFSVEHHVDGLLRLFKRSIVLRESACSRN